MANKVQLTKYYAQIVSDSTDADFLRLISSVSGIEAMRTRNTYRCSLHKLPEVLYFLRGIETSEQLSGFSKDLYDDEMRRRSNTSDLKQFGAYEHYEGMWTHQDLGICLARYNSRYNFFYDTRTGKTRMSYQIMLNALKEGRAKRCLVLAPSTIIPDWLADGEQFPELMIAAYYKDEKQKRMALAAPCNVMIWSEGMLLSSLDMLKAIGFDMVVFDESSKLKSHKAQLSKAALELSSVVPSWYNLSATPAPNGEHEYYTQMRVVDPYAFPTARSRFISKYFDNVSRDPKWEKLRIKPDMRQAFMQVVNEYSIYVDQAVMPMAGKVWHDDLLYEMSDTTKEQYKRMANGMVAEVQGQIITAEQAASMRAKLNQITSGFLLDTDAIKQNKLMRKLGEDSGSTEAYRLPEHERLDYLSKLLQYIDSNEPGTPVVIWANYAEEFAMLQELLGSNAGYIRGGTTTAGREEIIRAFRERKLQYLVAHPLSVGMGINLTVSHNAVYYSVNDSWEALKQSSERICGHITVQPTPCHYWVIQAKETVNVLIYNNVKGKRDASIGFMEHLKAAVLL